MKKITYKGEEIPYTLIRTKIKNLYIHIKNGQVTVKAPIRLKEKQIEEFINKKAKWIYEKVKEDREKPKIEEKIEAEDLERLAKIVEKKIQKYVRLLEVSPNKVRIRDLNYAWGSCSSNRNISINSKLAKKEEKVIEYVVLHEMCHLIYMNHSKQFWNLVEKNMPDYKIYKKKLKD